MPWSEWQEGFHDRLVQWSSVPGSPLTPNPVSSVTVWTYAPAGERHDLGYPGENMLPSFSWNEWRAEADAIMSTAGLGSWDGNYWSSQQYNADGGGRSRIGQYGASDGIWTLGGTSWTADLWARDQNAPPTQPEAWNPQEWQVADSATNPRGGRIVGLHRRVADQITRAKVPFPHPLTSPGGAIQWESDEWEWTGWRVARLILSGRTGNDLIEFPEKVGLTWLTADLTTPQFRNRAAFRPDTVETQSVNVHDNWQVGDLFPARASGNDRFIATGTTLNNPGQTLPQHGPLIHSDPAPIMSKSILITSDSTAPDTNVNLGGYYRSPSTGELVFSEAFQLLPVVKTPRWRYWIEGPEFSDPTLGIPTPPLWLNVGVDLGTYLRGFGPGRYRVLTPMGWDGETKYDLYTGMGVGSRPLMIRLPDGWKILTWMDPIDIEGGYFSSWDFDSPQHTDPTDPHGKPYPTT